MPITAQKRRPRPGPAGSAVLRHYWLYSLGEVSMTHGTDLSDAEARFRREGRHRSPRPDYIRDTPCDCPR